jgi:hypothetical protein
MYLYQNSSSSDSLNKTHPASLPGFVSEIQKQAVTISTDAVELQRQSRGSPARGNWYETPNQTPQGPKLRKVL